MSFCRGPGVLLVQGSGTGPQGTTTLGAATLGTFCSMILRSSGHRGDGLAAATLPTQAPSRGRRSALHFSWNLVETGVFHAQKTCPKHFCFKGLQSSSQSTLLCLPIVSDLNLAWTVYQGRSVGCVRAA